MYVYWRVQEDDLLDIQLTVTKRTKRVGSLLAAIEEINAQQRDAVDDGSADRGNEQQNGGSKQAESAKVVNDLAETHVDGYSTRSNVNRDHYKEKEKYEYVDIEVKEARQKENNTGFEGKGAYQLCVMRRSR